VNFGKKAACDGNKKTEPYLEGFARQVSPHSGFMSILKLFHSICSLKREHEIVAVERDMNSYNKL
jgi:hypothetical protein